MPEADLLNVLITTPQKVLFEGTAESVILPGEKGVFELWPHHKAILSRLLSGRVLVDGKPLEIRRGVVKASLNQVTVVVEEASA